ncbi:MAG: DUF3667 domain-containing protein [Bacteroidia bacterium]|nr:DUF3667 domain-containing protein [Bacteroidia bacterium]
MKPANKGLPNQMSQHTVTCKNCENQFTGHFCNNCGQKANLHRIDLKHLLHEFFHATTHLDKGLLYTAKKMLLEPGKTIRDYLNGKRVRHSNPFLMLLIIGGLCSLTYYNLELKLVSSYKITELDGGLHVIDSKFFAILYILYSLFFSICDYIIFHYKGYNFTEYFTMNVFIATEVLLGLLILVPLWLIGGHYDLNRYLRFIVGLGFIGYLIFVRYHFFEVKNDKKAGTRLIIEAFVLILFFFTFSWKTIADFFQ